MILLVLSSSALVITSMPFCSYASGISSHADTGFRESPVYNSGSPVYNSDKPMYNSGNPVNNTDRPVYKIITIDGRDIMGTLLHEDEATVTIEVEGLGELTIRKENIQSIQQLGEDSFVGGRYWFPNPHATRHLFAPNAIPLKKGAGYYQNTWIFFNNLNYGVSDRFSVGVGMVPIFLFGARALPLWLLPKYSIPIKADKWHISAGGMIGGVIAADGIAAGVLYSTVTYGNRDRNITGGIGFGFSNEGLGDRPVLNLSGMYRMSVKTYLITENYFFSPGDGYDALWSFGMRYALESFSIDFALLRPSGTSGGFIGIPWLGVALPLNR